MVRPLTLLIGVAVVASIPTLALAQTWPATAVAGAPRIAPQAPAPALTVDRTVIVRRPAGTLPTQPSLARLTYVIFPTPLRASDIPEVEVRAKEAWLDDQGLRLTPTRVAFKRRF